MRHKSLWFFGFTLLTTVIAASCIHKRSSRTSGAATLTGDWKGTYTCSQGLTGLTLSLTGDSSGNIEGIFKFYSVPENPKVKNGMFRMHGTYGNNRFLSLTSTENDWIENPSGYKTVDLKGMMSADLKIFNGDISRPKDRCSSFSLSRE